jgi:hypothetical protein
MPKLHELLAVEGDLKARAQQAKSKITKLFTDGTGRLLGRIITYQVDEGEDPRPPEVTELATTTQAELDQFQAAYSQWLDVAIQKEVTNQATMATVSIEAIDVFGYALPSTALLNLESKLVELKSVYSTIPTLDPSERWEWDEGQSHYVSVDRLINITKKVPKVLVLSEATEQHPAQTQPYHEDVKVGTRTTVLHSGMLTPKNKREILDRIDKLLRAVKEARQRANDVEITDVKVAEAIFNYIRE